MLARHEIEVWYSVPENLPPGTVWPDAIGEALRRCDWFLVVLSPSAVESMWVKREVQFAIGKEKFWNRIVPFMSCDCDPEQLHFALGAIQSVDFRENFDNACRDLLAGWGIEYKPETK